MEVNNSVLIEDFAQSHFIKSFKKKYKTNWDITLNAITVSIERLDNFLNTDKAEDILGDNDIRIIKVYFKIARTNESAKSSGNRCIIAWHLKDKKVYVLLVYHKADLSSKNNETSEWMKIIKENYPRYKHLI